MGWICGVTVSNSNAGAQTGLQRIPSRGLEKVWS
jgi:hypothetical protein